MSLTTKQAQSRIPTRQQPTPRLWKVPASKAWWLWLAVSLLLYGSIFVVYEQAIRTQQYPGPFYDPLRFFGIIAFVLVLFTAAYSLRRRFMRGLPGKAQNWLWMHTWLGIVAILIALLHSNYIHILNNFCQNLGCFSEEGFGFSALVSLFALVISGVIGRLLDMWQARAIAQDASRNGTGIMQALEERILELEYTVERLCAGKSEPFKNYCVQALDHPHVLSGSMPRLYPQEQADFRRAHDTLSQRAQLVHSLRRQQRARFIIRTWRKLHICIATIALLIITAHSLIELLTYVFNVPIFQRFA
ncbi:MAG TPA: hypothetical protein VKV40_20870 [Ktedonobacteraceae bacterium]|nr:hypothetical protein [Ktedonobacteraceae bacterium]